MNRISDQSIDDKPVRYEWWCAAFLLTTVILSLTSAAPGEFAADNNSGSARSFASTDSNLPASVATIAPLGRMRATPAVEHPTVEIPRNNQTIYYWIDRARDVVQRHLVEPSTLAASPDTAED